MLIARIVALAFAAAGLFGIVIAWPDGTPISPESVTEAVTLLVTAIGSIYAAWRTWRAKQLEARPAGVTVPPAKLATLEAKARSHDELLSAHRRTMSDRDTAAMDEVAGLANDFDPDTGLRRSTQAQRP